MFEHTNRLDAARVAVVNARVSIEVVIVQLIDTADRLRSRRRLLVLLLLVFKRGLERGRSLEKVVVGIDAASKVATIKLACG